MRLLPVAIAALIAVSSVSVPSTAKAEDLLAASICDYVKSNDKNRLRKKLKENRMKLRNIYSGISCDGESCCEPPITATPKIPASLLPSACQRPNWKWRKPMARA